MPDEKPLTNKDLNETLNKTLGEFSDAILIGVEGMMEKLEKKLSRRFDKLLAGQRELQRQINDLKADTPTIKKFKQLEEKVYYHHPSN